MRERAILAVFDWKESGVDPRDAESELRELSAAAGVEAVRTFILPMREPNPATYMGRGKAEEIASAVGSLDADVVIVDTDLPANQQRNLEEILAVKTIDRTQLILDIFARRARSNEGKLQVELAQLQYLLPRLGGQGIYLSRLGGGVGTRGPGEQKLEMDRRRLRERIVKLSAQLKKMRLRRFGAIEKKKEKDFPLVSLVGYTNAGKSTLFNRLTESAVLEKDQLFSTLDTTTRLAVLPGDLKVLLADTVGFVRRLPHHLVESFRATLEEALHADLLLHVVDASRPDLPELLRAVETVLGDLGVDPKKVRYVFNKIDALSAPAAMPLAVSGAKAFFVSARSGEGVGSLTQALSDELSGDRIEQEILIPRSYGGLVHLFYENAYVLERTDLASGTRIRVRISPKVLSQLFKKYPDIRTLSK